MKSLLRTHPRIYSLHHRSFSAQNISNPEGLKQFGEQSTALEVTQGLDLSGKIALVTGTSDGIGVETARALLTRGATVVGAVRDLNKMKPVADDITASSGNKNFEAIQCDLSDFDSIRNCGNEFLNKYSKLDILICNAGVMATDGRRETKNGFEFQFGVNHLGHFLLSAIVSRLMMDLESGSRLVSLSSVGHKRFGIDYDAIAKEGAAYDKWVAYGLAKTANILFAREFNRRFSERNALGFSAHPGGIQTSLGRELTEEDLARFAKMSELGFNWKTVEQGAATSVTAATSPFLTKAEGGAYLHDCNIVDALFDGEVSSFYDPNIAPHAMDDEMAKKLWDDSEEFVGQKFDGM